VLLLVLLGALALWTVVVLSGAGDDVAAPLVHFTPEVQEGAAAVVVEVKKEGVSGRAPPVGWKSKHLPPTLRHTPSPRPLSPAETKPDRPRAAETERGGADYGAALWMDFDPFPDALGAPGVWVPPACPVVW
jgi:hypothetical protein